MIPTYAHGLSHTVMHSLLLLPEDSKSPSGVFCRLLQIWQCSRIEWTLSRHRTMAAMPRMVTITISMVQAEAMISTAPIGATMRGLLSQYETEPCVHLTSASTTLYSICTPCYACCHHLFRNTAVGVRMCVHSACCSRCEKHHVSIV